MYRIDNSSASPTMPSTAEVGPNPNGYFSNGDPATTTPATIVDQDWLNAVQEEICNVVTGAGATLSKTNRGQLLAAIDELIGASPQPGRLLRIQTFTNSGTYTPTAGMNTAIVKQAGGGGGSAGLPATTSTQNAIAGGGGAGAYAEGEFTAADIGASQIVTIGAAGAAGAAGSNAGGNGGSTSFGSLQVTPGGMGSPGNVAETIGSNQCYAAAGGQGGTTPTGGSIEAGLGSPGGTALVTSAALIIGGTGGSSRFGSTPSPSVTSSSGVTNAAIAGGSPGAGASGGSNNISCSTAPGAAGAKGRLIVEEYS